ncbi:MAG TPA: YggS family pyridoxal phosphate-dependent enzyme [Bryobacteraceae bacterium]|nr:YggS family pyridoxal phosphate-dependent enzyme [Bryobacteraceae bacterium]HPT26304.1 YggS family pyridoxal phosphate-dependent enzyme [Bryobacteraceae bacterium]
MNELASRIEMVERRIGRACEAAGRAREDVLLLAVTKIFPAQAILDAHALGMREFGENYVQEFETKRDAAAGLPGARFHLIGHLQSNKAARAGELFDVIETVDSVKLARRLDGLGLTLEVYIEVKLSPEDSKHGASPDELPALVESIRGMSNLKLRGLMTMPPWTEDAEQSRPYFRRLRELAAGNGLKGLSMGMSHDLEVAIEEGSTVVRVGTALFGPRRRP